MTVLWENLGFIRWPLAFSLLAVVCLTLVSTVRLLETRTGPDHRTKVWIDAILFWGGFAVVTGVLGTLLGIIIAAQSIELAGEVNVTLVWGGMKIAMLSSALGVVILAVAALLWFALQLRWRMGVADLADGAA